MKDPYIMVVQSKKSILLKHKAYHTQVEKVGFKINATQVRS